MAACMSTVNCSDAHVAMWSPWLAMTTIYYVKELVHDPMFPIPPPNSLPDKVLIQVILLVGYIFIPLQKHLHTIILF